MKRTQQLNQALADAKAEYQDAKAAYGPNSPWTQAAWEHLRYVETAIFESEAGR